MELLELIFQLIYIEVTDVLAFLPICNESYLNDRDNRSILGYRINVKGIAESIFSK